MGFRVGLLSTCGAPALGYIIKELSDVSISIDCVITDSKSPNARERAIEEMRTEGKLAPIHPSEFEGQRIPFFHVQNHTSEECKSLVRDRQIDLLVNAGTPRILGSEILQAPKVGVVNCHPGLLPKFRGCTCVEWAIYMDEQIGNTVHFMSEGIDEGPIILREGLRFLHNARYSDVRVKVYLEGYRLLARGVHKVIEEGLSPKALCQQSGGSYFNVIPEDKLQAAIKKIDDGLYAYQID